MVDNTAKMKNIFLTIVCSFLCVFTSCNTEITPIQVTQHEYQTAIEKLTKTMVYDIFSPPVASRIYVYPNIAAYEIIAQKSDAYASLSTTSNSMEKHKCKRI